MIDDVTATCSLCGASVTTDHEAAMKWMEAHEGRFHPHAELEARALSLLDQSPADDERKAWIRENLQRELAMLKTDRGLRSFVRNMEISLRRDQL